jgi:glycine oxidase
MTYDVIVVGGGVIGCASAYELAQAGARVALLERERIAAGASGAAAGMLAPQSEAQADDEWFRLLLAARAEHAALAPRLREASGMDLDHRASGVLKIALDEHEWAELQARARWQQAAGLAAQCLEPADARRIEPALSPDIAGALWLPDETQVLPGRLTRALAIAAGRAGADVREGAQVLEVLINHSAVAGVRTTFETLFAPAVVLATGVWTPMLDSPLRALPIRPVKGQMLCALAPAGQAPRHVIWGEDAYLAPKSGGRIFVGSTEEDSFDARPTLAGVGRLAAAGARLLPALSALPLSSAWAGLRPAAPDRRPVIGCVPGVEGLFAATGHYRNGILLGPLTGKLVAGLVSGKLLPVDVRPYAADRFGPVPSQVKEREGERIAVFS